MTNAMLKGLKVLDFSSLLPGPYASLWLADMGAEVVKVESPHHPDMVEDIAPVFESDSCKTSYANLYLNRNKQSIQLDLKKPEAVEAVKKLIAEYDIVIEQYRPGVMAKLGLDYQSLKAINPQLIYCSITGYGQDGTHQQKAGHDINYLALSGLASYSGTQSSGPVLSGTQVADIAGGSHQAVMGILAAVINRQATSEGCHLDISMTDGAFALNSLFGAGSVATGDAPQLGRTLLNGGCFYDYYRTQDDKFLSIGGLEPKFVKGFFSLINKPEWLPLVVSPKSQPELKQHLSELFASQTMAHWMNVFEGSDVCVEPVLSVSEAAESELMKSRQSVITVDVEGQSVTQIAHPILRGAGEYKSAPKAGEHSQQILTGLGYSQDDINQILDKS